LGENIRKALLPPNLTTHQKTRIKAIYCLFGISNTSIKEFST